MKPAHQPRPRLCFAGAMLAGHAGYFPTQSEILAELLQKKDYEVRIFSNRKNRYRRLLDIFFQLIRHSREFDILLLPVYGGPSFVVEDMASFLGRLFGRKIIMTLHGGAMPDFMRRFPVWSRRVLSRADALTVPSAYLQKAVASHGFQARVIPNILKLEDYSFRSRSRIGPRLFWMRDFHPVYNPEMAVRVVAELKKDFPAVKIAMTGNLGPMEKEIRSLAASLGVSEALRFTGFLNPEEKRRELAGADIFLNTTRIDNMPVSVLEACASGVPVVVTKVGGLPDLLTDDETTLFVSDNDVLAMANAVRRLLHEPGLASRLSQRGRQLAERFDWNLIFPLWENLFNRLLEKGQS